MLSDVFGIIYFVRKKRNVIMYSHFDFCVLIVWLELICCCEQSCFVLLNVFGIFVFSEGEVLFCDVFLLVSFSSFCFFERCICYWNKSYFGLAFGFGIIYFFRKARCCFATCFCWFRVPSFVFFERRVCYWNKSCFGLAFWVWNYLFFRKASCCFATCLCWFRFPSFVFFFWETCLLLD